MGGGEFFKARLLTDVIVANACQHGEKFITLLFAAETAKQLRGGGNTVIDTVCAQEGSDAHLACTIALQGIASRA